MLHKPHIFFLFFLCLSLLLYGNTIPGEFVYDDFQFVNDPAFHDISYLPKFIFPSGFSDTPVVGYRPFSYITMNLHFLLVGNHPKTFHLVNIFLNAVVVFLVFIITQKLFNNTRFAFITSLLFAFFPIHSENVAYIKARDDMLSTALVLVAWLLLLKGKSWWSGCVYLLAVLSKELVLFAPLLFFMIPKGSFQLSHSHKNTHFEHKMKGLGRFSCIFSHTAAVLVYILLRFMVFGSDAFSAGKISIVFNPLTYADWGTKFWTNWKITGMYITKTFVPYNLSAGYQYNHLTRISSPFSSWEAWVGIIGVAALLIFALHPRMRKTPFGVGSIIFTAFFIPLPKILFQGSDIFSERWMYAPSAGLAMIAGYCLYYLLKKWVYVGTLLLALVLVIYSSIIIPRNVVWRNKKTLFTHMVLDAPGNVHGYYALAKEYYKEGDLKTAQSLASTGYDIYQEYPELLYLLGLIAHDQGEYHAAEAYLGRAIRMVRQYEVHGLYTFVLAKQGKYREAILHATTRLADVIDRDSKLQLVLGASYYGLGDMEHAKRYLGWDREKQDFVHRAELDIFLTTPSPYVEDKQ